MGTQTTSSGADIDLALADSPLHDFKLVYEFLHDRPRPGSSEFKRLFGFFLRMGGTVGRFLFRNPDDNATTNEAVGTTDGTASTFGPIVRTFGVGEDVGVEPVGLVDLSRPYAVYLDGVEQDAGTYEVLTTEPCNQRVKFLATPAAGRRITMDLSYFYYCKFPENTYSFEKFMDRLWLVNEIHIHTCRPGA
jgi:hypothetical protein